VVLEGVGCDSQENVNESVVTNQGEQRLLITEAVLTALLGGTIGLLLGCGGFGLLCADAFAAHGSLLKGFSVVDK